MSTGAGTLAAIEQQVNAQGAGTLAGVEQQVSLEAQGSVALMAHYTGAKTGAGTLLSFEHEVALRLSGASGTLASIEQNVNASASGQTLVQLQGKVRGPGVVVPRFEIDLVVGRTRIPDKWLVDRIEIERGENQAALMRFTVQPPAGVQDALILDVMGKAVTLDYTENGTTTRVYTGKVDIPEVDLLGGRISLRCTDARKERINAMAASQVAALGVWSDAVFGEPVDQADEVEKRLETLEGSFEANPAGTLLYTPWAPKTDADFTLGDADIYRREPQVEVLSRGRVVNKIEASLQYQYLRLRQREVEYRWTMRTISGTSDYTSGPTASRHVNNLCDYSERLVYPPTKDLVRSAVESTGWDVASMELADMSCGGRWCGTLSSYAVMMPCRSYSTVARTDDAGNTITDAQGNPVQDVTGYNYVAGNNTDLGRWRLAKRFTQNIEEVVTLTFTAPQSVAQYGEVVEQVRHGVRAEADAELWEGAEGYQPPVQAGFNATGYNVQTGEYRTVEEIALPQTANGDYYQDLDTEGAAWAAMFNVVYRRALTKIRGSHRGNTVTVETPMMPGLDLTHTVAVNAGRITCKGKAGRVRHVLDLVERDTYSEVEIRLSRATGSEPAASTLTSAEVRPARPDDAASTPSDISMGVVIKAPGEEVQAGENGLIIVKGTNNTRQILGFVCDVAGIEDAARKNRVAESASAVELGVRNDLLSVSFE